jgi:zinc transport system ATP-binding protein
MTATLRGQPTHPPEPPRSIDPGPDRSVDPDPVDPDPSGPVIAVSRLGVALGGLPVLREVALTVGRGQIVALLGGNGSGKTTVLRAILGLIPHQTGTINLFGTPQADFKAWPRLGYVPQHAAVSLHATTLAEVVRTGTLATGRPEPGLAPPRTWLGRRHHHRARVAAALAEVGLSDRAHELFVHLSGGQQQRALIARALAQSPSVLVLDEPLAGVDLTHQDRIRDTLAAFRAAGGTILVVLHETDVLAPLIDRAIVLRDGRVIHDGDLPESAPEHRHEQTPPVRTPGLITGIEPRWSS